MEKLIAERTEEGTVILEREDGTYLNIPVSDIPFEVSEGDVIAYDGNNFLKNDAETLGRKEKMLLLQQKLMKKSKNK